MPVSEMIENSRSCSSHKSVESMAGSSVVDMRDFWREQT